MIKIEPIGHLPGRIGHRCNTRSPALIPLTSAQRILGIVGFSHRFATYLYRRRKHDTNTRTSHILVTIPICLLPCFFTQTTPMDHIPFHSFINASRLRPYSSASGEEARHCRSTRVTHRHKRVRSVVACRKKAGGHL